VKSSAFRLPGDVDNNYNWEGDDFAKDIKQTAHDYFQMLSNETGKSVREVTKASTFRWFELSVILTIALFSLLHFARGEWWALFAFPVSIWMFNVNSFHDACHFSMSSDWRINWLISYTAPMFGSPWLWYHQHVIGHHAYPNIKGKDPDLYHGKKRFRVTEAVKWNPNHDKQDEKVWLLFVAAVPYQILASSLHAFYNSCYNVEGLPLKKEKPLRVMVHFGGRLGVFALVYLWPWFVFPWYKALVWSVLPESFISVMFMVASQVNHLTEQTMPSEPNESFYKQQVISAHDVVPKNPIMARLTFYFTGGLNYQIEHHLFPTVNHCHLPALRPLLMKVYEKHGVHVHESNSIGEALRKYLDYLKIMSYDNPADATKAVKKVN